LFAAKFCIVCFREETFWGLLWVNDGQNFVRRGYIHNEAPKE